MIRRRKIFFTCFLCTLGFALTVATLIYLTIPAMPGASLSAFDIILSMLGDPLKLALEITTLLLICGLAASLMTRVLVDSERQQLLLRKQLFSTYGTLQQSQDELRYLKETLKQVTKLAGDMAGRLRKLDDGANAGPVLTPGEYENVPDKEVPAYLKLALENVSDELSQASSAVREIMPSAHSLEHALTPLSARAGAAGEALAMLDRTVARLNRLVLNATLEAARLGEQGANMVPLMEEFKELGRETSEQAAAIGEQVWHVKETLSSANSPLSALVHDADATLRHLSEAAELLDEQWDSLVNRTPLSTAGSALTREVAAAAEQAAALEEKIHRLIAPRKREAA